MCVKYDISTLNFDFGPWTSTLNPRPSTKTQTARHQNFNLSAPDKFCEIYREKRQKIIIVAIIAISSALFNKIDDCNYYSYSILYP